MTNKAVKAIILSRVSSKDQEEGYSLEVRKDRLEKYCERKGLHIIQTFKLIESSTKVIINILWKLSNSLRKSENLSLLLLIKLIVFKEAKKNFLY
ncbi:MAG: hypothetical protein LF885_06000 [Rickettsia endosymbiont of Culicoides impunctatus]|nr:MAG: hypothetical protein LF885_06000 [Rickettsia endosymbiont of Culicoides impunctatus]